MEECPFKPGDLVECINSDSCTRNGEEILTVGLCYCVRGVDGPSKGVDTHRGWLIDIDTCDDGRSGAFFERDPSGARRFRLFSELHGD